MEISTVTDIEVYYAYVQVNFLPKCVYTVCVMLIPEYLKPLSIF